jgi:hypothetical protein
MHVRTDLQNERCGKYIEFCLKAVISSTSSNSTLCALRVHLHRNNIWPLFYN